MVVRSHGCTGFPLVNTYEAGMYMFSPLHRCTITSGDYKIAIRVTEPCTSSHDGAGRALSTVQRRLR